VSLERRELYASPHGDRWYLARYPESGRGFVQHEANQPSGGRVSHIEIGHFLSSGGHGPEHQALLRLIGTLVGEQHSEHADNDRGLSDPLDPDRDRTD
jgi:hypothetical protein